MIKWIHNHLCRDRKPRTSGGRDDKMRLAPVEIAEEALWAEVFAVLMFSVRLMGLKKNGARSIAKDREDVAREWIHGPAHHVRANNKIKPAFALGNSAGGPEHDHEARTRGGAVNKRHI
mgnify:CR=1 FL=1